MMLNSSYRTWQQVSGKFSGLCNWRTNCGKFTAYLSQPSSHHISKINEIPDALVCGLVAILRKEWVST